MSLLSGLFKVISGSLDDAKGTANTLVSVEHTCPSCGALIHGMNTYCESCNRERISSGIEEIKQAQKDPIIEAEKRGCEKATRIYRETFEQLKNDLEQWERSISDLRIDVDAIKRRGIELKNEKSSLEHEYESLLSKVAAKHQISESTLASTIGSSTFIKNPLETGNIFDLIYRSRERKIREAEQRGFEEGKRIFEEKIKKELEKIEAKSKEYEYLSNRTESLRNNAPLAFDQIAKEISNLRMKIAALKHGE